MYETIVLTWKRPQASQACFSFAIVSTLFSPSRSLKERTGTVNLLVVEGEVTFGSRNLDGTRVNPLSTCGCSNSMSVSTRLFSNSPTAIGISEAINHQVAGVCKLTRCLPPTYKRCTISETCKGLHTVRIHTILVTISTCKLMSISNHQTTTSLNYGKTCSIVACHHQDVLHACR